MHVIMSSKLFGGLFKKIFRLEAFKYLKKFPNSLEIIFLCIYLKINLILKWAKIREKGSQILFINQKSLVGPKEPKRCQKYHTFRSLFKLLQIIVTNIFGTIFGLKMVYYGSSTSNLSISVIELLVLFAKFGQNAFLKKKILHIFTDVTLFAKIKKQTFLLQIFFCKKFAGALWLILDTSNVKFVKKE